MNVFRLCGDSIHLFAFLLLIGKICVNKSCAGISGKTQLLIATALTCRYLDLFETYISLYNTLFKIVYILLAYFTLYLIFVKFRTTYDYKNDNFWNIPIIITVGVLAFFLNYIAFSNVGWNTMETYTTYLHNPLEITWTFSIYLEAIAIIPQFHMVRKTGDGQNILHYVLALTLYRGLYVCNWIYRYFGENHLDIISSASGTTETLILIILLIYIQVCKERNPKWQEITKIFTIEAAKSDGLKNPTFSVNVPQSDDRNQLLA